MAVVNLELMYARKFQHLFVISGVIPIWGIIVMHFAWGDNLISYLVFKNLALLRSQLINDHTSSALQVCLWDLVFGTALRTQAPIEHSSW
jgi:hypothetical protein